MRPSFTYTRGPVTTTIPWFRPNGARLNKWRDKIFEIPNIDTYNVWIVGGVLEGWDTWDIDVILQQDEGSLDYDEIERIMISIFKIGFDNRQLIDVHFQISPHRYLHPTLRDPAKYQATLSLEEFSNLKIEQEVLQIAMQVTKNGVVSKDTSPDPVKISDHMWKVKKKFPTEKHIERMKRGITYKKEPLLVTRELDFSNIINIGERHV